MLKPNILLNKLFKQFNNNFVNKLKQIPNPQCMNFAQSAPLKCWKCGADKSTPSDLFCNKCKSIQNPPQTENYFQVFKLNSNFDVDQKNLTQIYRKMQSLLHPDKFSNKSAEEKAISESYSSLVNKAYNTLQTPLSRALHLLSLNAESIGEDDKASDPKFLMEIMDLNEEVEDASTTDELKQLDKKNKQILNQLSDEINEHFKTLDIKQAKEAVIKMKYYNSLAKRINDLLREKGIVD